MTRQEKAERQADAKAQLLRLCPKGATVYCILRSVSRSGCSRRIDFYTFNGGRPQYLTGYMDALGIVSASLADFHAGRLGGMIRGGGMDMGFAAVYDLSTVLYGIKEANSLKSEWL